MTGRSLFEYARPSRNAAWNQDPDSPRPRARFAGRSMGRRCSGRGTGDRRDQRIPPALGPEPKSSIVVRSRSKGADVWMLNLGPQSVQPESANPNRRSSRRVELGQQGLHAARSGAITARMAGPASASSLSWIKNCRWPSRDALWRLISWIRPWAGALAQPIAEYRHDVAGAWCGRSPPACS